MHRAVVLKLPGTRLPQPVVLGQEPVIPVSDIVLVLVLVAERALPEILVMEAEPVGVFAASLKAESLLVVRCQEVAEQPIGIVGAAQVLAKILDPRVLFTCAETKSEGAREA